MPQIEKTATAAPHHRATGPARLRLTRNRAGDAASAPATPTLARSGRGATTNPGVRFETQQAVAVDDGWGSLDACFGDLPPLETTLIRDSSRTAIARNSSPDLGFDRSINPYRGCEHGCIYCFARPSHAYLGYSPGLDFETKLLFKPEIASLLAKELCRPSYEAKPITLGANTDPYQPIERRLQLTRQVLEVLRDFGHPVSIVTKSALVLRDLDILRDMAARGLAHVYLSITTLDPALARVMEPRASAPHLRLRAVAALKQAGVPVGVLSAPMIPGLNDVELEAIIAASAEAGASRAGYVMLRLPLELREMFEAWLHQHVPARAAHVLSLVRQVRGGALYDARFGQRFTGTGAYADLIAQRFQMASRRHGLNGGMAKLDVSQFHVPERFRATPASAKPEKQMSLF
ncbi:PA0069 family radical SAM protein [Acidisoma silvae]|uniref:PA0069 family radical SAM protein n=1 Tax=Acidisoma silvae TaxID=2802396 RepID=A0A964DZV5_9PROT|nr:PA0069 family radical SAM protein [Acidisoma silvae]MCB8876497.1 PA0069 family radical SAM protein [Acidisoma silvae]